MTTTTDPSSNTPTIACPQCHARVSPADAICPNCKVNLALAAALVEREVLASTPAEPSAPYVADVILPRFGEYLVERGDITEAQLREALSRQREAAAQGKTTTIGQVLLAMGVVTRERLDLASVQQVKELQTALQESNQRLEQRVAERTQELQQALQKLADLNQLKANFIMAISHELRTPLMRINGYTEVLSDDAQSLSDRQRDLLRKTSDAIEQLDRLIDDLIRFASSTRGELTLHPAPLSLPALAERVLNASLPKAAKGGLYLHAGVPADLPLVMADEDKLRWALFQLLDNAIKFTPAGGTVTLAAAQHGDRVRVSVRDTGIGIPLERMGELFTPFHQLDGTSTRRFGGTGLGLALVKRIVEAHQGWVEVESQPGRGSTFSFDLPLAPLP
jgi:signal transduction histidine kinase